MYIKELEFTNFRIYKNNHRLFFTPEKQQNVFIIAGNNGYGKTTFLTALVWCLYGKYMKDVDEVYKTQINESGGYARFLQSCLNRLAYKESEKEFSVSITFADIDVPSLPCNEIKITRNGFYRSGIDEVKIYIDGHENELTKEVGNDLFIQDFILPKEVAKFFFFDSEKIVALAESKSINSKRQLSKAYSEVLGIQKYENLKKNLQNVTLRFKKDSAQPEDKRKFTLFKNELESLESAKIDFELNLKRLVEEKDDLKSQSDGLQEKLIREGSALSLDEISNMKIEKHLLEGKIEELKITFKQLLDLAPFAISGNLVGEVQAQLDEEYYFSVENQHKKLLTEKGKKLLNAFKRLKPNPSLKIKKASEKFYQEELSRLVSKYLLEETNPKKGEKPSTVLHDFSDEEYNEFYAIYQQLQSSYPSQVKEVSKSLSDTRYKYSKLSRKLSNAESKESDGVIAEHRKAKNEKDAEIKNIEKEINDLHQKIGSIQNDIASKRRIYEQLAKKVKIQERYVEKDQLAKRLIERLDDFIVKIKQEKKLALEKKILHGLKILMHKKNFIKKVVVEVGEDIIDILLYDKRGEEIDKDNLSKGEQQLYATSILSALVEESNIEFPVFIDSPLQKFDAHHAKNIIANFYPAISKQVVLFPLLEKEMTEEEYALLEDKVKAAYIINNEHQDFSYFTSVAPYNLFEAAKKLQANVL